jgi:chemotaxis protein MotB
MSTMDAKKVQEAIGSLSGALSVLEGGRKTEVSRKRIQLATPIEDTDETADTVNQLQRTVVEYNEMTNAADGPVVSLEESEEGFIIRLPANLLFESASAKIVNEDALLFLKRITLIINEMPNDIHIMARGHTDNQAYSGDLYVDNWGLSTARGASVVRELVKNGVNAERVSASGHAEFDPIASNATAEGREKNRRVDLYFFTLKQDQKDKAQESVLDIQNQVE